MRLKIFVLLIFWLACSITQAQAMPPLYVFVGEKIEVAEYRPEVPDGTIMRDFAFKAKYKVLEKVYGDLKMEVIEFTVCDHYGKPAFSKYRHVLLYVIKCDGTYVHSKYLFSPLYKTKDGRWAGPYDAQDYLHPYNKKTDIKPEPIQFDQDVVMDLKGYSETSVKQFFPVPYYRIEGRKAVAVYGNYIEELFELKKRGVLKARKYFE